VSQAGPTTPPRQAAGENPVAASLPSKATETLSQFIARVLDQLSLSAWLPAGALILLLLLVFQLGTAVDNPAIPDTILAKLSAAIEGLTQLSVGGIILLLLTVVVLTVATQAFAFESIRVLEGYWGTNPIIERLAAVRCSWHRFQRRRIEARITGLTGRAWLSAKATLLDREHERSISGRSRILTDQMIGRLEDMVLDRRSGITLTPEEQERVDRVDWRRDAPPELQRRLVNLDKKIRDYPEPDRLLPTRLGNVLRAHEDRTGDRTVETLVQRRFDSLPLSLQVEHDEQRTRLDLYCSMVFVVLFATLVAIIRLIQSPVHYAIAALVTGLLITLMMYRAAIASARAYGNLIIVISEYSESTHSADQQGTTTS
jgi:hypothetical protein